MEASLRPIAVGLAAWTALLAGELARGAEASAERPTLNWGADAEGGAPYIFKDPNDLTKDIGFEVDLIAAFERELSCKISFVQYQFSSLIPGLEKGDIDLAMNGVEVTPERQAVVRFSRPYYVYTQQLVVRADDDRIKTLDDVKRLGGVVGTLEATAADRLLDQMQIGKKTYDSQVEPYRDLELGRTNAVLLDYPIALYYAKRNEKLKFVGPRLAPGYYAIAFRKEDEALARRFDDVIARMLNSGELRDIYDKWGLWNDDQTALSDWGDSSSRAIKADGQWSVLDCLPMLLLGAWMTVKITFAGMTLAVTIGLPIALMRLSRSRVLRGAATVYVEFFRGIPVLLLLFFLYYGQTLVNLSGFAAAVIGFGLNYAAYEAEIYRAGIRSIAIGQWEAAASLGMSAPLTFRRIILPQAIRVILPPMTNDFIALFKDTSVVSVIAVVELTKQYQIYAKSSAGNFLVLGLTTAALYLAMSIPLSHLAQYFDKRWGKGR